MWGRKFIYLLLIFLTSYITLMYEGKVPGVLLALELLFPLVLFLISWYLKASVSVELGESDRVADCGEKVRVNVQVKNKGILPVTDMSVYLSVCNLLEDEDERYDMNLRVPAGGTVNAPFTFRSTYCGVVRVYKAECRIYDYLRLFVRKKKVEGRADVVILPKLLDLQVVVSDMSRTYDSESDEFDKHRPGDDPSEIYQLREFRQGDKMSRVHWKMTARVNSLPGRDDTLMVKELSLPVSNAVGLYLDLRYEDIDEIQSVYNLCYSLSAAMVFQECPHWIIWYRGGENPGFEQHLIRTVEDLTETVSRLMKIGRRTENLMWDEYCSAMQIRLQRVFAITCCSEEKGMENFMDVDGRKKTVLTIDQAGDLIEI